MLLVELPGVSKDARRIYEKCKAISTDFPEMNIGKERASDGLSFFGG
jgi:hypothetical protein